MSVAVIGANLGSYLPVVLLTVSLLIGVPVAYRYYRDVRADDEPLRDSDLLADLVQGDAASKMTEAEFRRVRALLTATEPVPGAKIRAKPPRPKPEAAAAVQRSEESNPGEHSEHNEETREDVPETEAKQEPSG